MPMTTSADSGVLENPNRRVKVYVLGIDGQWDDRGTGYVSCELLPVSKPWDSRVDPTEPCTNFHFRFLVFQHILESNIVLWLSEACLTHRNSILLVFGS
jgi:hypothetical protein